MTAFYTNDFEAAADGVPTGWTVYGNHAVVTASSVGVTAIQGTKVFFSNLDASRAYYTAGTTPNNQAIRFATRVLTLGANFRMRYPVLRSNAAASVKTEYVVYPESNGSAIRFTLYKFVADALTQIAQTGYVFAPGASDVVHFKAKAIGTTISAAVWLNAGTEPTAAVDSATAVFFSATDGSIASGVMGEKLRMPSAGTDTSQVDQLVLTDGAGGEDYFYPPVATDTTAPVLSSPTASATSPTTATATVSTTEAAGLLYTMFSTNANEAVETIRSSGQSQAVTATGVQTVNKTGLTANTAGLKAHFVHDDAQSTPNVSNVVSSATFATPAAGDGTAPTLSSPTALKTGSTTATGTVSTNDATGVLRSHVSANATESEATMLASGVTQAVTATGVQNVSKTGLTPSSTRRIHYMHTDPSGNHSAVASSATITLDAAPANPTVAILLDGVTVSMVHAQGGLPKVSTLHHIQFLSKTDMTAAPLANVDKTTNVNGTLTPWAQAGLTAGVTVCLRAIDPATGEEGYYDVTPTA